MSACQLNQVLIVGPGQRKVAESPNIDRQQRPGILAGRGGGLHEAPLNREFDRRRAVGILYQRWETATAPYYDIPGRRLGLPDRELKRAWLRVKVVVSPDQEELPVRPLRVLRLADLLICKRGGESLVEADSICRRLRPARIGRNDEDKTAQQQANRKPP